MQQSIIIYPSKIKLFSLFILGICMTGLCASEFIFNIGGLDGKLVGLVGVPFFALCTVLIFLKLLSNKPSLIIDAEGITDNGAALNAGFIPWNNIEKIFLWEMLFVFFPEICKSIRKSLIL